ncbi:gp25 [Bacillus phage W.Ph.]|uniref:Gp25 n=1 Tax=Bacillus phage W.Ph. TaxID=764595 RepID=G9B1C6_9CAUD|nr:gp25 [Bacillus phage W.Ph.]ADH03171.1 gp25 [Bacillus phage W.Ph.]
MTIKFYSKPDIPSKFDIKDFKPDIELTRLVDNFHDETKRMIDEAVQELDNKIREEIEFGIVSSGYDYEAYTISKTGPEIPSIITLYPSEKTLILLGVIEHRPDHEHFTNIQTFKFRLFDGYNEVYKGSRIFSTQVKTHY